MTVAGGVTTAEEIRAIDELGADCQVGMALYTGRLGFAEALVSPMRSGRSDGLWPTVVTDVYGTSLGLVWSNAASVAAAIEKGQGVYWSRRRGLWAKGENSGATQILRRIELDCDRDALRFIVEQEGRGFCHNGTWSCFGEDGGISALWRTIRRRKSDCEAGSYTRRLFNEPGLLDAKIMEEAGELVAARTDSDVVWETADLLYFALVRLASRGKDLADVERELDRRAGQVTRRKGDAKKQINTAIEGQRGVNGNILC